MLRRIRGTQIRMDLQLSYLDLKSFFPPLAGQPKKHTMPFRLRRHGIIRCVQIRRSAGLEAAAGPPCAVDAVIAERELCRRF